MKTELRSREDIPPIETHRVENASDPAQWPDAELTSSLKGIFPPIADIAGTIKKLRGKDLYLLAPGVAKKPLSHLPPLPPKSVAPVATPASGHGAGGGGGQGKSSDPRVYVPTEQEEKEIVRKIELSEKSPPRPFIAPPPPEKGPFKTIADLAASEGASPEQIQARKNLARDFYAEQCPEMNAADIKGHVAGIDFTKPVKVVDIPPDGGGAGGNELVQHSFPGRNNGQYFVKTRAVQPEQVGIRKSVLVPENGNTPPRVVPRETRDFTASNSQPAKGLQSTSAPIVDTWSHSGEPTKTSGGGTQIFVPNAQQKGLRRN